MQIDWQPARDYLRSTGISVEPVTEEDAEAAALLWRAGSGLSLADRLCLSLGRRLGLDTITADRAWGNFPNVTLVR
jgi:PIN domain nuclease of toxin-antitoxin system